MSVGTLTLVPSAPARVVMWSGRVLTAVGLIAAGFLAYEFVLSSLSFQQAQLGLVSAFKTSIQSTRLDAPDVVPAEGSPVAMLKVPELGIDMVVVEGTTAEDLKAGPGHLRVSPLPGEFGNAVIVGRRTTYGGMFRNLDRLRAGDTFTAVTGQGTFNYKIAEVRRAAEGNAAPLTGTLDSRLTLVTSDPALVGSGRLYVVAKLQGRPVAVARRAAPMATVPDLGLAADPTWLAPGFIWTQLVLVAAWLTWRMRRRWPPSVLLMFAVPTIVGLAVLAYSSFDRALPGAL
jgi:LPXTG-site transpeptidase (sortase) family protein